MAKSKTLKKKKDPLPEKFKSLEDAADFWDTHDATDYEEFSKPVTVDVRLDDSQRYFELKRNIARKLSRLAKKEKISAEVLLNRWVEEYLLRFHMQPPKTKREQELRQSLI